jgi:hypothetical protein
VDVGDDVVGDGEEPAAEGQVVALGRQGGERLEEDLAGGVLGLLAGAQAVVAVAVDGGGVAAIECDEGLGVALGRSDEVVVPVGLPRRRTLPHPPGPFASRVDPR